MYGILYYNATTFTILLTIIKRFNNCYNNYAALIMLCVYEKNTLLVRVATVNLVHTHIDRQAGHLRLHSSHVNTIKSPAKLVQ
jgi:hypothetical protein